MDRGNGGAVYIDGTGATLFNMVGMSDAVYEYYGVYASVYACGYK